MQSQINYWLNTASQAFSYSYKFMIWNLLLAFIPLGISFWLFRERSRRTPIWWLVFVAFIAFLPNAPYVVTDIVHLVDISRYFNTSIVTLVLIPQYSIFIFLGMEAYVISLIKLTRYLQRIGKSNYIIIVELSIHALCAIGIYLGRFLRFNSWDLIFQPNDVARSIVDELIAHKPILVMVVSLIILTVLYRLLKFVTLGAVLQLRSQKKQSRSPK
jgi:uncharacterized membrane protein